MHIILTCYFSLLNFRHNFGSIVFRTCQNVIFLNFFPFKVGDFATVTDENQKAVEGDSRMANNKQQIKKNRKAIEIDSNSDRNEHK